MSRASRWFHSAQHRCLGFVLILALALSAGLAPATAQQTLIPVRVTLDWRFEGPAALFLLGLDKGYFADEGLSVTIDPGSGTREAIQRVASGDYDLGFADVNALVRYRDDNPKVDLKAVMMVHDRPPYAIIGRKSRGVTDDVKSLMGKKFGAPTLDAAFGQWPLFKAVNKLDDATMKFENVGFPVREPMLASGEVDAVFGFAMTSAINLKSRGVQADDITTLLMSDHGLELYGNAIIANPKFAAEHPDALKGFLRAFLRSIRDAANNPDAAVEPVLKRNELAKKDVEIERLKMVLEQNVLTPYVKEHGIGGIDKERFERALDQLGLVQSFKTKPKVEDLFVERFLPGERQIN